MTEKKSIIFDIILTFLTLGMWNLWVQYRQMRDYNKRYMRKNYSFFIWLILTLITFGLYHAYHEYKLTRDLLIMRGNDRPGDYAIVCAIATLMGLWFIVDSYQQAILNEIADKGVLSMA